MKKILKHKMASLSTVRKELEDSKSCSAYWQILVKGVSSLCGFSESSLLHIMYCNCLDNNHTHQYFSMIKDTSGIFSPIHKRIAF